jgi:hypothetical protein
VIPWTHYLAGNPRYHDPADLLRTAQQLSEQTVGKARVEGTLAGPTHLQSNTKESK